jgi:hypothetical protein
VLSKQESRKREEFGSHETTKDVNQRNGGLPGQDQEEVESGKQEGIGIRKPGNQETRKNLASIFALQAPISWLRPLFLL